MKKGSTFISNIDTLEAHEISLGYISCSRDKRICAGSRSAPFTTLYKGDPSAWHVFAGPSSEERIEEKLEAITPTIYSYEDGIKAAAANRKQAPLIIQVLPDKLNPDSKADDVFRLFAAEVKGKFGEFTFASTANETVDKELSTSCH